MCWFVTVGCTAEHSAELEEVFTDASLSVRRSTNPHLTALFPPSDVLLEITPGGCSCDLWMNKQERNEADLERSRRRYQKKGWSEGKIARALEAAERVQAERALSSTETRFRELLMEQVRRMGGLRLFAHFFAGSQDEEQLVAEGEGARRRVGKDEFLTCALPADVLLDVVG